MSRKWKHHRIVFFGLNNEEYNTKITSLDIYCIHSITMFVMNTIKTFLTIHSVLGWNIIIYIWANFWYDSVNHDRIYNKSQFECVIWLHYLIIERKFLNKEDPLIFKSLISSSHLATSFTFKGHTIHVFSSPTLTKPYSKYIRVPSRILCVYA